MVTEVAGDSAELEAAVYFRRLGHIVSAPWGKAPYDLVIDMPDGLVRVEVKSTTQRGHVKRGCKAWGWVVIVDSRKPFDWLYAHTPDLHYLIPRSALTQARGGVTLPSADDLAATTSKWVPYVINR